MMLSLSGILSFKNCHVIGRHISIHLRRAKINRRKIETHQTTSPPNVKIIDPLSSLSPVYTQITKRVIYTFDNGGAELVYAG